MNGIATTLAASILVLAPGAPAWAFAPVEDEPAAEPTTADAPAQAEPDADALPSLDELLGLDEDDSEASAADQAQQEVDQELQRRLHEVELSDIFTQALEKMALSVQLLQVDFESGLATQRVQQDVLEKLDQLIDRARELSQRHSESCQCSECRSKRADGQRKPGDKPGSRQAGSRRNDGPSSEGRAIEPPPGREGDINTVLEETGTEWGHLPVRIRELLRQGRGDYKSPLYRQLTEEYYKRLAEDGST
jgi:hypothetical protein